MKTIKCEKCNGVKSGRKWYHSAWSLCYGHPTKVSELEELTQLDNNDYIMISDMSCNISKKVSLETLRNFFKIPTRIEVGKMFSEIDKMLLNYDSDNKSDPK